MSERFKFSSLDLSGLVLIKRLQIVDNRGYFERLFCAETFSFLGFEKPVVQINRSLTKQCGAVRGLHFQYPPHSETKIVTCLKGEIFDVAVDLRKNSRTFLKWHGENLSAENCRSLFIPEGFAHGFQTLTDDCELLYLHTAPYAPGAEGGINPLDPLINVHWPLPVTEMSDRDSGHAQLDHNFTGVEL